MRDIFLSLDKAIQVPPSYTIAGSVSAVKGMLIEARGLSAFAYVGSFCSIETGMGGTIDAEVVGFRDKDALLLPYGEISGIGLGASVILRSPHPVIFPCDAWKGRVIDCFANPIDEKGGLAKGQEGYSLQSAPPKSSKRARVGEKMDMGVAAINIFTPCCIGQRLGIFAGSGVGKSVLLSMFTKYADADIKVIGLIGERGREVKEFIEDYLGEEGLQNAVIVVSTSDEAALARRRAAYVAMTVAEYFRDQGRHVLLMIDSITRFAMALREIGLVSGEPPTNKGYTPSVFAQLPKLLERAGPGVEGKGMITGIFSTLVEGDDNNEPISDAVRSILDGHIVLSRDIASSGRFPAVDVLSSISRMAPGCNTENENSLIQRARALLSIHDKMSDLVRIGAYRAGSDALLDEAIVLVPKIEGLISQPPNQKCDLQWSLDGLDAVLRSNKPTDS